MKYVYILHGNKEDGFMFAQNMIDFEKNVLESRR